MILIDRQINAKLQSFRSVLNERLTRARCTYSTVQKYRLIISLGNVSSSYISFAIFQPSGYFENAPNKYFYRKLNGRHETDVE